MEVDEGSGSFQSLTVQVTDVNEAPIAAESTATGDEDTVISGVLTASDVDGDALTFAVVNGPSNGPVTIGANGSFQFTPVADFNGTDSFTFRASDGALSDTETATITVNPVDEPVDPVDPVDPPNPTDPPGPVDPPAPTGPTNGYDTRVGAELNDTINALSGNDKVTGLAGDDLLIGGGGNDSLLGQAGDDRLRGNGGDDTVKGGGGADRLNGGADLFQFRASDRNDTISDFRQGQDKIQIQSGARTFEALRIEQDGADVLIGFGAAGQIRVVTDQAGAFDESDFIF